MPASLLLFRGNEEVNRDITKRRRMEEALRMSEERLGFVLENSLDAVFRVKLRTRGYAHFSPYSLAVWGYSAEMMMAMGLKAVLRSCIRKTGRQSRKPRLSSRNFASFAPSR